MKKLIIIFLVLMLLFSIGLNVSLAYGDHSCPVCDFQGYFTGKSKIEWGHLFYLYKCPASHYWWERQKEV